MDYPVQTRQPEEALAASTLRVSRDPGDGSALPAVALPLLARSASLLNLLFQDGTVDLELASSVVGLDPGLAFGTLQLANRDRVGDSNPVWAFPLAVVAAGRDPMLRLVRGAPRIEPGSAPGCRTQLCRLYSVAVLRACVAQFLSQELGNCDPRKSFLAGLLLELPAMVRAASAGPSISPASLLSAMCGALPSAVVTAALAGPATVDRYDPLTPVGGIARIADSLVTSWAVHSGDVPLEKLASGPLWRFWDETGVRLRSALLGHCLELAKWVSANWYRMDPWEFMARLERCKLWE
jgi:hypothetical protein